MLSNILALVGYQFCFSLPKILIKLRISYWYENQKKLFWVLMTIRNLHEQKILECPDGFFRATTIILWAILALSAKQGRRDANYL